MNNFGRALRLALSQRWTFIASVLCALGIAALWGGNITAIYPVMEVAFNNQSLHQWAEQKIEEAQRAAQSEQQALDQAAEQPPLEPAARNVWQRDQEARRRAIERHSAAVDWYQTLDRNVLEPIFPHDPFRCLVVVVGCLVVGTLAKAGFMVAHSMLVARMSQLATFQLRKIFYRRTLRMELARFGTDGTSDLMNRFTSDMESLAGGLNELLGKLVREPLKMLACFAGAAWISWRLLLVSLLVAPLAALSIRWLAKALKKANRRAMEEMSGIYAILEETFQGIKIVKAFTMERQERFRFHRHSRRFYERSMRIARYDALTRPLIELIGITTIALALLTGAYLVIHRETHLFGVPLSAEPLDINTLLLFYGFLAGLADPARKLSEVFSRLQRGAAACDRIYQLIDREPTIVDPPQPVPLPRHHRTLSFEGIEFAYTPSRPVLQAIDLHVEFGETIAIVGPNGCGKSTLASLIPRFYDPGQGCVRIDGVDLRDVRLNDLRRQIGLVNQETLLFDESVYNNIRYGSPGASRAQIVAAAQRAHAHRFIEEKLEHGYDTLVGARGQRLSGGQRQRIALARAILRDPSILILDEATSQVDLESEQLIQRVLEQFKVDRTTIIITHRLGILALADRIVVMNAGRIADVGTHAELMRRCDLYGRLHDMQLRESA